MSDATYHLCPRCLRTVPSSTGERYCSNDGTKLISRCPACRTTIRSPYARHCTGCGLGFALLVEPRLSSLEQQPTSRSN